MALSEEHVEAHSNGAQSAERQSHTDAPAPSTEPPPEKRGAPRHPVDGPAVILLINVGSRLPGRILDLSLGGCRVRTDERFPVGIYTRIEAEFQLEGMIFRLGGVVQAIFNRHTVGVRFLDLSDRKRQQLEQLIREVAALQKQ